MLADKMKTVADVTQQPVRLVQGGSAYFTLLLQLIAAARDSIHLQTYIFDDDETGEAVAAALKSAASRNVKVYLLADGYASQVMSQHFINALRDAGVQFRFFEPLFRSRYFYFGRRLHHKIFVADSAYALVGGINITNRYNDLHGERAWLDFALYIEGAVAAELCVLCWKTWNGFKATMPKAPCEQNREIQGKDMRLPESVVHLKRNDWVRNKREISNSYISMFRHARSHITIVCSYFLPGKVIRRLLSVAAARGVKIKIITAGPSDVMMAKHAERWLYDWLLRNKIELYEYQPTVLHAKIAVCDGEWFTVGSYNINIISAYASIELNLDVHDPGLAADTEQFLLAIAEKDCRTITPETLSRNTNILQRLLRWFSYHFIRSVFYLLTFYYKQRG